MVIVDETFRSTMLSNGAHHYIQPEPFSPDDAGTDAKSSPLAMLQKTCSSIGADTSSTKLILSNDRKTKEDTPKKASPQAASPLQKTLTTFRPYDMDRKEKCDGDKSGGEEGVVRGRKSPLKSPDARKTPKSQASPSSASGTSPITRPGSEVLAGVGSKDLHSLGPYKSGPMSLQLPPYLPPDIMVSAALRPTLPALPGLYSQAGLSAASYLSLQHQQHQRLGEKCNLPYCPCAFSSASHGAGAPCPPGCTQCDHAKASQALNGAMPSPYLQLGSPFYPPGLSGLGVSPGSSAGQPIVCSWMSEGRYCGKRFSSTEELMQHLRTHTSLSPSESAFAAMHPAYQASLLAAHKSPFVHPHMSSLPTGRYHPYAKPPVPGGLGLGVPHPGSLAAAYYSPYSTLYSRPSVLP